MIESIILKWLKKELTPTPEAGKDFVLFEKTSGKEDEGLNTATFAFQSYGGSLFKAASLNERVKKSIKKLAETNGVIKAELNSDYNFTDLTTKRYRYQAVFDITYYKDQEETKWQMV